MTYNPPLTSYFACPSVFSDTQLDHIADTIADKGWLVIDGVFSPSLLQRLSLELESVPKQALSSAGVGRSNEFAVNKQIRNDRITWIDASGDSQAEFLKAMDDLRLGINQRLFMGLFDYESHFAVYEPGAYYKTHRDAFRGQKNRILTTVLYLNESWDADDKGELVIYNDNVEALETVLPKFGRLVIFLSEEFPHEVRPTKKRRTSIAGWFRMNQSTKDKVDPSR